MTPEQRKRVAEVVKNWVHYVEQKPGDAARVKAMGNDEEWDPAFEGSDRQRSQALAVVEWIAKAIEGKFESYMQRSEYSNHLRRYIAENNIEALGKLVLVDLASEINSDQLDVEEG